MRVSALNPVILILLLSVAAAKPTAREPVSADFRLVTELSQTVVRAGVPVAIFANLTNKSEYNWSAIRVGVEAYDEFGSPLLKKVFEGQTFNPYGSRACTVVFRFEDPARVLIRVTLTKGKGTAPFFVREHAARIAVTPVDVSGEGSHIPSREGCR